jgi:acetylxylan esterase
MAHTRISINMRPEILTTILSLGVPSFAAQLTQVQNYGGSARAKPGMYVRRSNP